MDTAGDGVFATFHAPGKAIACACSISDGVRSLGLEIRAGLHAGEVERLPSKVGGLAVLIGARIAGRAKAGEVLVSRTLKELVVGSGIPFRDQGAYALRGLPGRWRLFAVDRGAGRAWMPEDAADSAASTGVSRRGETGFGHKRARRSCAWPGPTPRSSNASDSDGDAGGLALQAGSLPPGRGPLCRLARVARPGEHQPVIWRRSHPVHEPPLSREDVLAIFEALADIKAWTRDILKILEGEEDDGEEEAEP